MSSIVETFHWNWKSFLINRNYYQADVVELEWDKSEALNGFINGNYRANSLSISFESIETIERGCCLIGRIDKTNKWMDVH